MRNRKNTQQQQQTESASICLHKQTNKNMRAVLLHEIKFSIEPERERDIVSLRTVEYRIIAKNSSSFSLPGNIILVIITCVVICTKNRFSRCLSHTLCFRTILQCVRFYFIGNFSFVSFCLPWPFSSSFSSVRSGFLFSSSFVYPNS